LEDDASSAQDLEALLTRVAHGDGAALELIYRRTSAKLFGICLRILMVRPEAEEALQEVYVSVWQRAATYRSERGDAMAWLIALARNRSIDRLRARRPIASEPLVLAETVADPAPLAAELLGAREERDRLEHCLNALAAGDATMIRTAFFEGASYSDLARRSTLPLGTVKSRIRRALLRLRECLQ
jgi:RNA polymerase sigma factor (sigma-70 family)